jgi:hypothetical protein
MNAGAIKNALSSPTTPKKIKLKIAIKSKKNEII